MLSRRNENTGVVKRTWSSRGKNPKWQKGGAKGALLGLNPDTRMDVGEFRKSHKAMAGGAWQGLHLNCTVRMCGLCRGWQQVDSVEGMRGYCQRSPLHLPWTLPKKILSVAHDKTRKVEKGQLRIGEVVSWAPSKDMESLGNPGQKSEESRKIRMGPRWKTPAVN